MNNDEMTVPALIGDLKDSEQDFEFYPTTDEIINKMLADIASDYDRRHSISSVLDIGAGNGKVLLAFKSAADKYGRNGFGELYAIEKALPLCGILAKFAFIIGTDFKAQSLLSKHIDLTFCNPPYSEFEEWAVKIIRESASRIVYLVLPVRWQKSARIKAALEYRKAEMATIGEFDFEDAEDRKARAVVNLIRVDLDHNRDAAFDRFFDEQFSNLKDRFANAQHETEQTSHESKNDKFAGLVGGKNILEALVNMYDADMDKARKNYELAAQLDVELLRELSVSPESILSCLKTRLAGLKSEYWKELFSHMRAVTDRLCKSKRNNLLGTLNANGHVDFTAENAYAILIWILEHANQYIDVQLIETFEKMVEASNIKCYKSNQRVFKQDKWRYNEEKPTHIALEYRLVLHRVGGIKKTTWSFEKGLDESGCEFLQDILTVANNLGFQCDTTDERLLRRNEWTSGRVENFYCTNDGKREVLFEVRAFYNWNIHIRLNQKFALALNVEHGRLKGWLTTPQEAEEELQDPRAASYFNTAFRLCANNVKMLAL